MGSTVPVHNAPCYFSVPLLFAVALSAVIRWSAAHPQCLDWTVPFQVEGGLRFCNEYAAFGCCTLEQDRALYDRYSRLLRNNRVSANCRPALRRVLCQECSPYAAHIFGLEYTHTISSFPALCPEYCSGFFRQCSYIVPLLTNDSTLIGLRSQPSRFCDRVKAQDPDYCYPDLVTNPQLTLELSSTYSSSSSPSSSSSSSSSSKRPVSSSTSTSSQGCLCVEEVASGLRNPVFVLEPDDGSERLFVGEQIGVIHIYYGNGSRYEQPFLDARKRVITSGSPGDERGLLSMAFHPNYKTNGKFYLYYSLMVRKRDGVKSLAVRLSELRVSRYDPNRADPQKERVVLEIAQPQWNHNGGQLLFGDDGYLYLSTGDGGGAGDRANNAQTMTTLLGKVLRININKRSRRRGGYGIPRDNPWRGRRDALPEIWAYGVRNMWRCSKDRGDPTGRGKGRIFCGDVGQSKFEEIDIIRRGGNYGWRGREGFECYDRGMCGNMGVEVLPIHAYDHSMGKSVIGGVMYRGCPKSILYGQYVYGDFVSGRLWGLTEDSRSGKWTNKELSMCGASVCRGSLQSRYHTGIISFGDTATGDLYMTSTSNPSPKAPAGSLYRLVDPYSRDVCNPEINASPRTVPTRRPTRRRTYATPKTPVLTRSTTTASPPTSTRPAFWRTYKRTSVTTTTGSPTESNSWRYSPPPAYTRKYTPAYTSRLTTRMPFTTTNYRRLTTTTAAPLSYGRSNATYYRNSVSSYRRPITTYTTPTPSSYRRTAITSYRRPSTSLYIRPATTSTTSYRRPSTSSYRRPSTTSYRRPFTTSYSRPTSSYRTPATTSYSIPSTSSYRRPATTSYRRPATTSYRSPATTSYISRPSTTSYRRPSSSSYRRPATSSPVTVRRPLYNRSSRRWPTTTRPPPTTAEPPPKRITVALVHSRSLDPTSDLWLIKVCYFRPREVCEYYRLDGGFWKVP